MANEQNLVSLATRTPQERTAIAKKGQEASTRVKREKASIKKSLNKILTCGFTLPTEIKDGDIKLFVDKLNNLGIDTKNMELIDLMNCGQILASIGGNSNAYKTLLEVNGETEVIESGTPTIEINVVDNSNLEKTLYETNKHSEDVKR